MTTAPDAPSSTLAPLGTYPVPPPTYKSTGDQAKDTLAFFHVLEKLKTQKRGGWVREGVKAPESIADHMYRMAVLAMCVPTGPNDPPLDVGRCVQLAIVHDLAEAHVGDITPVDGVSKVQKQQYEEEAMHSFLHEMLGADSDAAKRIGALWNEYETMSTPEARFVKDLDRFELVLQTVEYERSQGTSTLPPFLLGSLPHIRHPAVQGWAKEVIAEREEIYAERGGEAQANRWDGQEAPVVGGMVCERRIV